MTAEVALSISNAPDGAKLGFSDKEEKRILFTVCTYLIRAGYNILYSGDLRPGGYTFAFFEFLKGTYAGQEVQPFINLLPEPVVRRIGYGPLKDAVYGAQGIARFELALGKSAHRVRVSANSDGLLIRSADDARTEITDDTTLNDWLSKFPTLSPADGFTQAREIGAERSVARVSFGGKMGIIAKDGDQYEGAMPGIAEEAILTVERKKLYIPLGAFGGATRDVAIALGLLSENERVPRGEQAGTYDRAMATVAALRPSMNSAWHDALAELAESDRAEEIGATIVKLLEDQLK